MEKENHKFTPPYSRTSQLNIFDRKHYVHFLENVKTFLSFNFFYPIQAARMPFPLVFKCCIDKKLHYTILPASTHQFEE